MSTQKGLLKWKSVRNKSRFPTLTTGSSKRYIFLASSSYVKLGVQAAGEEVSLNEEVSLTMQSLTLLLTILYAFPVRVHFLRMPKERQRKMVAYSRRICNHQTSMHHSQQCRALLNTGTDRNGPERTGMNRNETGMNRNEPE